MSERFRVPESPDALHVPYLTRQPWECATVLDDGTCCGLPIVNPQFRFCHWCNERFLNRKAKKHEKAA